MEVIDPRLLNGTFLPGREALEKYRVTKIEPLHDTYRLDDHKQMKDFEWRKGSVLHSSEFIYRVQKINPLIFVQHQINFPDDWGLYIDLLGKQVYLSAVPKGWLTEFSYTLVDHRDLVSDEKRGWRTVLRLLLTKGALTWDDVEAEFGESDSADNNTRWLQATSVYREHSCEGQVARNLAGAY